MDFLKELENKPTVAKIVNHVGAKQLNKKHIRTDSGLAGLEQSGKTREKIILGKTMLEWGYELGISKAAVRNRIKKHGDPRIVGSQPIKKYFGKTALEWSEELGIHRDTVYFRIAKHGHPRITQGRIGMKYKKHKKG